MGGSLMTRRKRSGVWFVPLTAIAVGFFVITGRSGLADDPGRVDGADGGGSAVHEGTSPQTTLELAAAQVRRAGVWLRDWYVRTPPPERVTWGGLVACGGLGLRSEEHTSELQSLRHL